MGDWGCSSNGRALGWYALDTEFDPQYWNKKIFKGIVKHIRVIETIKISEWYFITNMEYSFFVKQRR